MPAARPCFATRPLVAALAVLAASPAVRADEPNPYYIGVTESITHDSNVYRLQNGGPSDTYYSTGLVGGFDQSYGRQRFYGSGNVRYNKYQSSDLSNTSYGLNAGLDWATVERLSGSVGVSGSQSLATIYGNQNEESTNRQLVRTGQISTSVRYGGAGRFSLGADYAHSIVRYSGGNASDFNNSSGDSLGGSVYYNVNPDLTAGVGYRITRTVQPNGVFVANNQYDEVSSHGRNIDLTLNYHYSALTNVGGRLSFTRQSNSGGSGQDFSGLTGGLNVSYALSGKTSLNLAYARDAGTNGNFFNVASTSTSNGTSSTNNQIVTGLYTNSQVTDSLTAGINYAATAKVGLTAGYTYRRAKIAGTSTVAGVSNDTNYNDSLRVATLGASYTPLRWLSFGCNLAHENRTVASTGGYGYSDNTVSCTAQATLR